MIESDDRATLSSIHGRLIDLLADLDRAGRHAAAAHLVAVLELIEGDLGITPASKRKLLSQSLVTVIATRMSERFGDRAKGVARRQLADASGAALLAWAAILNCIPSES